MKANELRIGNYVMGDSTHRIVKLDAHDIDWMYRVNNFEGSEDENLLFEPIPLNERILLNCGFIKYAGFLNLNNGRVSIDYMEYHGDRFISMDIEGQQYPLDHIKHLHQLQNLWYILTNSELKIQL